MTELHVDTQSEAWREVVRGLLSAPRIAPRGIPVREMPERTTVVISRPQAGFVDVQGRVLNYAILAAEAMALVGQTSVPEAIVDRVAAFAPFTDGGVFWGAYGPRIAGDLVMLVDLMKGDPDTRQAVLTLYDSGRDLMRGVKDVPCTVAIQFFLRERTLYNDPHAWGGNPVDKFLDMWVVMRSNDAWLGLPYDLGQFSLLQVAVAGALDARIGTYTHSVGSMHLYERDYEAATKVGDPARAVSSPSFAFGGARDIESVSRRARRLLLGQGDGLFEPSSLDRWLADLLPPLP